MKKVIAVARWEYLEKVRSKAFLIGLFLTPMLMVGMAILPGLFVAQEDHDAKAIGIVDATGAVAEAFARTMGQKYLLANGKPNYVIVPLAVGKGLNLEQEILKANGLVASKQIEGYCLIPPTALKDTVIEYRSSVVGDFRVPLRIQETVKGILTEMRSGIMGVDPALVHRINVPLDVHTVKISKEGEEEDSGFEKVFFSSYIFLMMLFFLIVTSGQLLVRSVIEEKSNRIVEVLVSSCSPTELMAGKVLGLSALGLTQMAFWGVIGLAVSAQFGLNLIDAGQALLLLVYFILGYLFYSAVFIAAGSPLTTEQEAQQVTSYLVMVLILPVVLALPAMKNPDATWLKVLTYFPPLTPTMMALRIPIQMPAAWEILTTVLLMIVSIYLAMVAAGRIFRIAILSTGKTPKIKEILRWVRTS